MILPPVEFPPRGVSRRDPDRVHLDAVLVPCVVCDPRGLIQDDDRVVAAMLRLVDRWRRSGFVLAAAGWPGLAGDDKVPAANQLDACNCRPALVLTAKLTRQ